MSLTYQQFANELALLSQFNPTDANFLSNLPSAIDYATDRIVRELNLLNTVTSNSSLSCATGTRIVDLSSLSPIFNVLNEINVLTPATSTTPDTAARSPLIIQTTAFLNAVYGTAPTITGGVTGVPQYFAMVTDQKIMIGPYPDANYRLEIIGTVRPSPLSQSTSTNWISLYLPDLYLAAAMIQMSGFMRNFGAQADDPKMAMSWESQFVTLRDSAATEDSMRKYYSTGWTSQLPNQFNPVRT